MSDFKESDMYEPVVKMFEKMGYSVRGEVKNCDITATKDGETIIIEMKKSFNIKLVYQIIDRQTFARNVYACIPRKNANADVLRLLKRLDAGLITVALDSPLKFAQIVTEPSGMKKITNSRKKKAVENEAVSRTADLNTGGTSGVKLVTAYREKSIELLCLCDKAGRLTRNDLIKAGYEEKTYSILYKNYYRWFKKEGRAVYSVSEEGKNVLKDEKYETLIEYYKDKTENYYKTFIDTEN
jgi:hypothetical protein